nr:hypothetical protein [Escherichia coli]
MAVFYRLRNPATAVLSSSATGPAAQRWPSFVEHIWACHQCFAWRRMALTTGNICRLGWSINLTGDYQQQRRRREV